MKNSKLSRFGVFIRAINELLKRLKKNPRDLYNQIDPELLQRIRSTNTGDNSNFSDQKPSENQEPWNRPPLTFLPWSPESRIILKFARRASLNSLNGFCLTWGVWPGELKMGQSSVTLKNQKKYLATPRQTSRIPNATLSSHKGHKRGLKSVNLARKARIPKTRSTR
ncbi:MAG: hypothetical protein LBT86_01020 [Deltaproteobacteria bacterium]|jgi:hypothetical protein|nr:hypothetical protein [Deltaproteobacteria bacterium]